MNLDTPQNDLPQVPMELWERATVLRFFGGVKPLNVATLYRGIATGRYPEPVHVSGNAVRWIGAECRAALAQMIANRDGRKVRRTGRRGRPARVRAGAR